MTVKDLLKMEVDIDVYDDVCEELGIAFCGPQKLTKEGRKKFAEVLDFPVEFFNNGLSIIAIVQIDDQSDEVWESRLEKAKELFEGAAGYCSCEDYDRWFEE